jgi:hypothetical protein
MIGASGGATIAIAHRRAATITASGNTTRATTALSAATSTDRRHGPAGIQPRERESDPPGPYLLLSTPPGFLGYLLGAHAESEQERILESALWGG